jgi:uncharacterized protein (TIGR04255 family)
MTVSDPLPKFDSPPVVETVLSAQFDPIPQFNEAHGGWFWKKCLPPEWKRTAIAPRLEDQFERFGEAKLWGPESLLMIRAPGGERIQIFGSDDERMIQIQNTRFLYNWRKQSAAYPSYEKLHPEFMNCFQSFTQFVKQECSVELTVNQWEVTYVNHILKGDLWETPEDWTGIFPWFAPPTIDTKPQPDDFQGEWSMRIGENLGRLHISLKHVRIGSITGREALALQLTARGPLHEGVDLEAGLNIGHECIVRSFTSMTDKSAHEYWKRRV